MKFNLKNRPRKSSITKGFKSDMECFVEYVEEWFEGFEKELRGKLNPPEVIEANKDDEVVRWVLKMQNTLIKEILGES